MTCPVCGASLGDPPVFPGGSVQCTCGTTLVVPMAPVPGAEEAPPPSSIYREPLCPRCQAPLELREEEGVVLTACPVGHGLFVARPALEAMEHESFAAIQKLDATPEPAAPEPTERVTPAAPRSAPLCPRCDRPMREELVAATGVVVDVCKAHGTWFDAGELSTVVLAASARHVLGQR